jgi:histidine triad (HIT) family protein
MQQPSIFTHIISGDIPSHKVYEDEKTLAFLDIHPVATGHVLVIPKIQVEFVWDLPVDEYRAVMDTVQKVALRLRTVMGAPYIGERIIGTDVPHAHVQLIPFTTTDQLKHDVSMDDEPDHAALAELAQKLYFS